MGTVRERIDSSENRNAAHPKQLSSILYSTPLPHKEHFIIGTEAHRNYAASLSEVAYSNHKPG